MGMKHAVGRKAFEAAFSAVYKYVNKDREKNMLKLGIAERAYRVVCVCDEYSSSCYSMRNSFLVEHSVLLICGFSGDMRSGTASTMRRARREHPDDGAYGRAHGETLRARVSGDKPV